MTRPNIFNDSPDSTPPTKPKGRPPAPLSPVDIAKPGTESAHQKALFAWAALNRHNCPDLEWLFSIPNGGKRDLVTASRMKAEGVRAGVPDIFWPVPRHPYHGLFVEMKIKAGTISPLQRHWGELLSNQGYKVVICYSWVEASNALIQYYNGLL